MESAREPIKTTEEHVADADKLARSYADVLLAQGHSAKDMAYLAYLEGFQVGLGTANGIWAKRTGVQS